MCDWRSRIPELGGAGFMTYFPDEPSRGFATRCPPFDQQRPPIKPCARWWCPLCRGRLASHAFADLARVYREHDGDETKPHVWFAVDFDHPNSREKLHWVSDQAMDLDRFFETGNHFGIGVPYVVNAPGVLLAGFSTRQPWRFKTGPHRGDPMTWAVRRSVVALVRPGETSKYQQSHRSRYEWTLGEHAGGLNTSPFSRDRLKRAVGVALAYPSWVMNAPVKIAFDGLASMYRRKTSSRLGEARSV